MEFDDLIAGEFLIKLEEDMSSVIPTITQDDAIDIATRFNKGLNIKNVNILLLIKSYNQVAKLVYLIDYFIDEPIPKRPFFIIGAHSGEVFETWGGLPT